jgi:ribosomal protein L40E
MKALALAGFMMFLLAGCGSAPEPRPEPLRHAERLNEFGFNAFERGRYDDALRHFREVERQFLSLDHPEGMARAAISQAELALRAAAGQRFWEASAREVAGAVANVGVQNCGQCGLSLSANARFCRRCGTRQG